MQIKPITANIVPYETKQFLNPSKCYPKTKCSLTADKDGVNVHLYFIKI